MILQSSIRKFNQLLRNWNDNVNRELLREGKVYEYFEKNYQLSNGDNPVLRRFWKYSKETFHAFRLLSEDFDFSYLFTDADKEFIVRYFDIDE